MSIGIRKNKLRYLIGLLISMTVVILWLIDFKWLMIPVALSILILNELLPFKK